MVNCCLPFKSNVCRYFIYCSDCLIVLLKINSRIADIDTELGGYFIPKVRLTSLYPRLDSCYAMLTIRPPYRVPKCSSIISRSAEAPIITKTRWSFPPSGE